MKSLLTTAGLARASARRPWRTLAIWLILIVAAGVVSGVFGGALSDEVEFTNKPESVKADELIEARLRGEDPLIETVVIQSSGSSVDDPAFRSVVERTTAELRAMPNAVASVVNYYELQAAGDPMAASLVSDDRRTTIMSLTMVGNYDDAAEYAAEYVATAESQRGNGFEVYAVGDVSGSEVYGAIAEEDTSRDLQIGLPAAFIVLVVVFGALVAAGLPILLGVVSIALASSVTLLIANVVDISTNATVMITMIGLAVGIDYALFLIERYREERRHGQSRQAAIENAGATAGKAVFFSGGTVVVALLGMFLLPITIFQSLAIGAILAVLIAVIATQTFVPALLSLLGDKIDWPRRRRYDAAAVAAQARYDRGTIHAGFWGRMTKGVMTHPVVALVIAVALLVGAALPVLDLETGFAGIESLPESRVKTGFQILDREFYAGTIAPVEIVIDGDVGDAWVQRGVASLTAALGEDSLYGPATVQRSAGGDLTLVSVPMALDPNANQAYTAIDTLREKTIPRAFGNNVENVYVTGSAAGTTDFNALMSDYTPIVFAFVLGLSFLLLMMAFRSLVVPLKAIVMNLLSVGAAYGVLVAVFQKGFLADTFGFQQTESIAAWLPIFLFCVLFGL
ncbi:MAG: efflux RND transporter permease subunit, partial [Chloroflexota bacterium]|nr:efflux RND transporter permease subunit [Chloroflexota bacterium]